MLHPPFKCFVLACSAFTTPDVTLRKAAGISPPDLKPRSIRTNSFHLIGIEDRFKGQSEEVSNLFADNDVMYYVGRDGRSDEELCLSLREFMCTWRPTTQEHSSPVCSDVSGIFCLPLAVCTSCTYEVR
jgi:hypothetical protein